MEFKNFENKLIVEKITNYCIENNINAQQINALTAKIKFGTLNEAPVAPNSMFGNLMAKFGTGTAGMKYNYGIGLIQKQLQTAITAVGGVMNNISPGNPKNIFKTYNINIGDAEKQDLINAVTEFQTTLNGDVVKNVKTSLEKIGGSISGSSNFGDESSAINFDISFPELAIPGTLDTAFNKAFPRSPAEIKKLIPQIKSNINASIKDKDPLQINSIIKKFKDSLTIAVKKLNSTAAVAPGASAATPKAIKAAEQKHQSGYSDLVALAKGRFPADTNTPTASTPAPPNPARVAASLADSDDFTPEIAAEFKNSVDLRNLIKDAFKEGKKYNELEDSFLDLTNDARFKNFISSATLPPVPTADVPQKIKTFVLSLRGRMGL